jgi:hypothetical protein
MCIVTALHALKTKDKSWDSDEELDKFNEYWEREFQK